VLLHEHAAGSPVEELQAVAGLVEVVVQQYAVVVSLVSRGVVGDEHLVVGQDAGPGQGGAGALGEAEAFAGPARDGRPGGYGLAFS
jgi:hypothetical protein